MKVFLLLSLFALSAALPTKTRLPASPSNSKTLASPVKQKAISQLPTDVQQAQSANDEQPAGLMPYAFEYASALSSRTEKSDGDAVKGQYTVMGEGGVQRIVNYIADKNGFRAAIATNEFGTEGQAPADVAIESSQPKAEELSKAFGDAYIRQQPESEIEQKLDLSTEAPALPAPVKGNSHRVKSDTHQVKGKSQQVKSLKAFKPASTKSVVQLKAQQPAPALPLLPQLPAHPQKPIQQEEQQQEQQSLTTQAHKVDLEESTDSFGEQNSSFF